MYLFYEVQRHPCIYDVNVKVLLNMTGIVSHTKQYVSHKVGLVKSSLYPEEPVPQCFITICTVNEFSPHP